VPASSIDISYDLLTRFPYASFDPLWTVIHMPDCGAHVLPWVYQRWVALNTSLSDMNGAWAHIMVAVVTMATVVWLMAR
jgi:hypothetical protein